jgi:hypothetical protein
MKNTNNFKEFECFGESLSTHPNYLQMKRNYEENLLLISLQDELEMSEETIKFVSPVSENLLNIEITENKPTKKPTNEKNILRNSMDSM